MGLETVVPSFPFGSNSRSAAAMMSRSGSVFTFSRKLKIFSGTTIYIPDNKRIVTPVSLFFGPTAFPSFVDDQDRSAKSRDQSAAHQIIDRSPEPPNTTRPDRSELQNHPVSSSEKVGKQEMSLINHQSIDPSPEPPYSTRPRSEIFQNHQVSSSETVGKQQIPLINTQIIDRSPEPPYSTGPVRSESQIQQVSLSEKVGKQQEPLITPQIIDRSPEPPYTTRPEFQDSVAPKKARVAHKQQQQAQMPLVNPSDAEKILRVKDALNQLVTQNAQKKQRKEGRTMTTKKIGSGRMMMDRSKRGFRMTSSVSMATTSRAAGGANDDPMDTSRPPSRSCAAIARARIVQQLMDAEAEEQQEEEEEEYCHDTIIWCEDCDKECRVRGVVFAGCEGEPCSQHGAFFYPDIRKPKPCLCGHRFFKFVPGFRRLSCGHRKDMESSFICRSETCGLRMTETEVDQQLKADPDIVVARRSCPFFCQVRESPMLRDFAAKAAESEKPTSTLGVFTRMRLPAGVIFGPYKGIEYDGEDKQHNGYSWDIHPSGPETVPKHVDALDERESNWLRYINCCRFGDEQNLEAFQFKGEVYYRAFEAIPPNTELLVYYGPEFASEFGSVPPGEEEVGKEKKKEVEGEAKPKKRNASGTSPVPRTNKPSCNKRKRLGNNLYLRR